MRDAIGQTQAFFQRRNDAWMTGDDGSLETAGGITKTQIEMRKRRNMQKQRNAIERKVIADVQLLAVTRDESQDTVIVDVSEHLRMIYELEGKLFHERRVYRHFLHWRGTELVRHDQLHESGDTADVEDSPAALLQETQKGEMERFFEEQALRGFQYDRTRAFQYAERYWNERNPAYHDMGDDCTNFISQVLYAGGFPMIGESPRRAEGWWYRNGAHPDWSYSWAVAHMLVTVLTSAKNPFRVKLVSDPRELQVGDVIAYDWKNSGRFTHTTVVVDHDKSGAPLINAHTVDSHRRYFSYEDSYAWTPDTRYLLVHFLD